MSSGGARVYHGPSFSARMTDAFGYPCRDPFRLLALAVILRWQEDGSADEIGSEWAEMAEVPQAWLIHAL